MEALSLVVPPSGGIWSSALVVLIDSGLKGLVLLSLAALIVCAMRRSSASARHLVWALALGGLLVMPLLSIVMPKWQLPILPRGPEPVVQVAPARPVMAAQTEATATSPEQIVSQPAAVVAKVPVGSPVSVSNSMSPAFWIVAVWILAAFLAVAPLLGGMIALARLIRAGWRLDHGWLMLVNTLADSIGLDRHVDVLFVGPDAMPMATGFVSATVLLPESATGWTDEKKRAVILHELAHVKRRDCLTHALARVAVSVHWFNPLAWMALRWLRIERERACDDLVLTAGERPSTYADHLLEIARTMQAGRLASAAAITMAKKSQLEGRLLSILDGTKNRTSIKRHVCVAGIFISLGLAGVLGCVKLSARGAATNRANEPELKAPLLVAHEFYPAGTDPVITINIPANDKYTFDIREYSEHPLFAKVNGREYRARLCPSPFSKDGTWMFYFHLKDDTEDGPRLTPGHYRVSMIYRDIRLHPVGGGQPREIKALESNTIEFDVVDRLPDKYFEAAYEDGWDKILRDHLKYAFNDKRTMYDPNYDALLLEVTVLPGLPFALAFDVFAQREGDSALYPAGTLNFGGGKGGYDAYFGTKALTWQNAPEKRWRLIFKPSQKVAIAHPPIRKFYGREVVGDWVRFEPTSEYKSKLMKAEAQEPRYNVRFLETKSRVNAPISVDNAEFGWRVDTTATLQTIVRGIMMPTDDSWPQNWGFGPNQAGDESPVEFWIRTRRDGDNLIMTTILKDKGGQVRTENKHSIPPGAKMEVSLRTAPITIDNRHFVSLWENRFVRDGKTLQTIIFAAAAAPMGDKEFANSLDFHGRAGKDFPLVRLKVEDDRK
ncbi:M56 family metallopeptidase [bacterium]|nr:M56 family metallopeptidase [bacterium]